MGAEKIIVQAASVGVSGGGKMKVVLGQRHDEDDAFFGRDSINGYLYLPADEGEVLQEKGEIVIALVDNVSISPGIKYDYRALHVKEGSQYQKYRLIDHDKVYNKFYIPNSAWSPDLKALVIQL
jgi:hypothetical protein